MSIGLLMPNPEEAVILRGPRKTGISCSSIKTAIIVLPICTFTYALHPRNALEALITQFVQNVYWGDLDYLVVDTPPGIGDEQLSIAKLFEGHPSLGAVLITTPQVRNNLDGVYVLGYH